MSDAPATPAPARSADPANGAAGKPAEGGLPGGGRLTEPPAREPGAVIDAAAAGQALSPEESDLLTAHYLGNAPKPGANKTLDLTVSLDGRDWACTVRPIGWPEYRDSQVRGEKTDGTIDAFVIASYTVARALVKPTLGPLVTRLQRDKPETAPADAAAMLRDFFEKQSGVLLTLSAKVLELSKLSNDNSAVKEVEAAKN